MARVPAGTRAYMYLARLGILVANSSRLSHVGCWRSSSRTFLQLLLMRSSVAHSLFEAIRWQWNPTQTDWFCILSRTLSRLDGMAVAFQCMELNSSSAS